jgi:tetratricopeptide (TPR) repeat protein
LKALALAALLGLSLAAGPDPADAHLVAGASAFREGRYDVALVEFRVAQKLGAADAAAYAAAALVKLGRPEEAVEAFGPAEPKAGDPLLDYYRAMACHGARLYHCAARLLAGVAAQGGPGMSEQAAQTRSAIAAILQAEPSTGTVDWYLARCTGAEASRRPLLAAAYCAEAVELAARRPDAYGRARAAEGLSQAQRKGAGR